MSDSVASLALDPRNPFLVLVWSFGLFLLMHGHQYVGALLAARTDHVSFDALMSGKHATLRSQLLRSGVGILLGLPLIWLCTTLLWNRPLNWMGLGFDWWGLALGLVLGLLSPFLVVGVLWRMNLARIPLARSTRRFSETLSGVTSLALAAIFAGISEEIVFRGMIGRELSMTWGWPVSVLFSGAFFGVVHLLGQLKTLTLRKAGAILVASVAVSYLFMSLYRFSGSLWLPIGFHIAWNFAHSALLGLRMNGMAPLASCLRTSLKTSSWMAGGEAGMEASLPAVSLYAVLGTIFLFI